MDAPTPDCHAHRSRDLTFSTANFLHSCMAANTGSRRTANENTHMCLIDYRPVSTCKEYPTCFVNAMRLVESNRRGRAEL